MYKACDTQWIKNMTLVHRASFRYHTHLKVKTAIKIEKSVIKAHLLGIWYTVNIEFDITSIWLLSGDCTLTFKFMLKIVWKFCQGVECHDAHEKQGSNVHFQGNSFLCIIFSLMTHDHMVMRDSVIVLCLTASMCLDCGHIYMRSRMLAIISPSDNAIRFTQSGVNKRLFIWNYW